MGGMFEWTQIISIGGKSGQTEHFKIFFYQNKSIGYSINFLYCILMHYEFKQYHRNTNLMS